MKNANKNRRTDSKERILLQKTNYFAYQHKAIEIFPQFEGMWDWHHRSVKTVLHLVKQKRRVAEQYNLPHTE